MTKVKKTNIDSIFDEMKLRYMLENRGIVNHVRESAQEADYTQRVEQNERLYEQEDRAQLVNAMMMLAQIMKDDHQDLKEAHKNIKKLQHLTDTHNSLICDMKKGQKKHSKQIDKLNKKVNRQQLELKKYRKQIKEQTKTLRALASFLELGTMYDDLGKIQKNCCKEIAMQRNNVNYPFMASPAAIDGKYREV